MKKTRLFSPRAAMMLLATLLLTLTAQTAWAEDPITGGCGTNVTYTIEGNTLTISGTGAMDDYTLERDQPWYYYNNITNLIIKEGVTHIGKKAFSTFSSLISVSFEHGSQLTSIGDYAFYNCKFESIKIPASVTSIGANAFKNCTGLTSVTIPISVTSIGASAFNHCDNLEFLSLGSGVTTISDGAFSSCGRLTTIVINAATPPTLGSNVFDSNVENRNIYMLNDYVTQYQNAWSSYANDIKAFPIIDIQDDNCGVNVKWNLVGCEYNYVLTISGTGAMYDYYSYDDQPWGNYRGYITTVFIKDGVTSIGDNAFENCDKLATLSLGSGVTSIGENAFHSCDDLATLSLGSGVTTIGQYAFAGCALTSLEIPNNVETIGYNAFASCEDLVSATIPNNSGIEPSIFAGCSNLTTLTITGSGTIPESNPVKGSLYEVITTLNIGDGIEGIGESAFYGCNKLATLSLGSGVTTIGNYAFPGCALTSLEIPNNVKTIGDNAFEGCNKLVTLSLGSGVTTIGDYAFHSCDDLATLSLGSGVTTIGQYAFAGCALTSLEIPNNVETIGYNAFASCEDLVSATIPNNSGIEPSIFAGCSNLTTLTITGSGTISDSNPIKGSLSGVITTLTIGDGIEDIDNSAFERCNKLATLSLGSGVTTIGNYAFAGSALTTLEIPNNVKTIGDNAFENCDDLATLSLGSGVTTIGDYTFYQCNSLDEVYCFADPFTTWEGNGTDFKTDPNDSNNKTTFYVTDADAWTTEYPDANVTYVGSTPVSYIDENGKEQSRLAYTVLRTDNPGNLNYGNLPGGWYVVENCNPDDENNGVDFYREANVRFQGDAHLILCDGAEMSVSAKGTSFECNGTLTIYGQSSGSGKLSVTCDGEGLLVYGDLTINGGTINCSTTSPGYRAIYCYNVVINGGTVTAEALSDGYAIHGDNVVINGGTVTANADATNGDNAIHSSENVVINGGTVMANGTIYSENNSVTIAEGMIDCTLSGGTKRVITEGATADATTAAAVNALLGGQEISISYSRTYTTGSGSGKASTLCLPFDFVANAADGTYATFTKVTETAGVYEVEMTAVADGATLTAGTPYMFLPKASGKLTQGNTAYTVPVDGFKAAGTETQGSWQFKGTFETKTWPSGQKNLYGFAGKEYYLSNGSQIASDDIGSFRRFDYGTCAAFRCYLLAPESSGARGVSKAGSLPETLKVRLVKADGTTTAIGTLDTRTGEVEFGDDWYDLNGRRLDVKPTAKGVYINNGKKIVIKN